MTDRPLAPARLLAVGDIHGYADKLSALLALVQPSAQDKLVFIGDYIDRGPDSSGVIERLIEFRKNFPDTAFLRGNHEQMLLDWLENQDDDSREMFLMNGGQPTLDSYGHDLSDIPESHKNFIRATQLFHLETVVEFDEITKEIKERGYLFVHAGVKPKRPLEEQVPEDLLWIRDPFIRSPKPCGELIVVHGHTPTANVPSNAPYRISVDSGVYIKGPIKRSSRVLGGKLTCCDVLTRHIWQV